VIGVNGRALASLCFLPSVKAVCTSYLSYAYLSHTYLHILTNILDTLRTHIVEGVWISCCKFHRRRIGHQPTLCSVQSYRFCLFYKPNTAHVTDRVYFTDSVCLLNLVIDECFVHSVMAILQLCGLVQY